MTKLYELHRGSSFRLIGDTATPVGSPESTLGAVYLLNRIDGMYSHCFDTEGNVVHLAAYSEVERIEA